jgi:hypothetical protein
MSSIVKILHPYFPKTYVNKAVLTFIFSLSLCSALFFSHALPIIWIGFAAFEVLFFFYLTYSFTKSWTKINTRSFIRKILTYSLIIRVIWVVFSYFFYIHMTGEPFEFIAADSLMYHRAGSNVLINGFDDLETAFLGLDLSDRGFPFYLSLIYFVFGPHIIIPRLINALLGAWIVVLIYHLARRNFSENVGRIAAIMMMLMPNLIYYCGIHLKEIPMVFLLVFFIERVDMLLRKRIRFTELALIAGLGVALFFFRTVLLASALFALLSMVLFIRRTGSNWIQRSIIAIWVVITVFFTFSYEIQVEFEALIKNVDTQSQNMEFRAQREHGNKLATYGSTVIFAPVMFVAPFPTFVNIETQQNQMMLSGGYFIKNILAFFILISIIDIIKRKLLRKYLLILSFLLSYLIILAQSSFALSERFHLPALPFLIILAAYGITKINVKYHKYYLPYLLVICVIIIAWNAFKLAGRGIV